jgi:hypothetical protein
METKSQLIELSNPPDNELTWEMKAAKNSVLSRGFPYYGKLKHCFPYHWSSFANMHKRGTYTEFPRTVEGFIEFILYLGDVPLGMQSPTIGRKDHFKGYIRDNFEWQEFGANSRDATKRQFLNGTHSTQLGITHSQKIGSCIYCGLSTNLMNLAKYHNEKCKHKKSDSVAQEEQCLTNTMDVGSSPT